MNDAQQDPPEYVDASPVKAFFVSMLTRDIKLEEAILDLLDNCIDGILRSSGGKGEKPYDGFKAAIKFGKDYFSISDNCGGIPLRLHRYAFRMGRSRDRLDTTPGSVGVYGIGMKRAIFKIGRHCRIITRNAEDQYEFEISPNWIDDETTWDIPVQSASQSMDYEGTTIVVEKLNEGLSGIFCDETKDFENGLGKMVSTHYAYILDKGFEVTVNGKKIEPRTTKIAYDNRKAESEAAVKPYVFKATTDGVDVFLAVGFTRPIPTEDETDDEQEATTYSAEDAGWTILCNDRAVLHCDRSELTGWGQFNVPRYHNQFIAISGIVDLRSQDPGNLPTTTTKRGIDASSPLYLRIKNKMCEGLRIYTDFTNKWKGRAEESTIHIQGGRLLSLEELILQPHFR